VRVDLLRRRGQRRAQTVVKGGEMMITDVTKFVCSSIH